jgi:hypothetical protein
MRYISADETTTVPSTEDAGKLVTPLTAGTDRTHIYANSSTPI